MGQKSGPSDKRIGVAIKEYVRDGREISDGMRNKMGIRTRQSY